MRRSYPASWSRLGAAVENVFGKTRFSGRLSPEIRRQKRRPIKMTLSWVNWRNKLSSVVIIIFVCCLLFAQFTHMADRQTDWRTDIGATLQYAFSVLRSAEKSKSMNSQSCPHWNVSKSKCHNTHLISVIPQSVSTWSPRKAFEAVTIINATFGKFNSKLRIFPYTST